MKPASEIVSKVVSEFTGGTVMQLYEKIINEARKNAIQECANKAKVTWDFGHKHIESAYVDKKSILDLIKELK